MKIRCIAVDDEPLALNKMKSYIQRVEFLDLMGTFTNGVDAMGFLKANKVDLVFLDIQMEGFTGIDLLESLHPKPEVIFTTAYDTYALKGYELDVSDYLLKPFSFQRFMKAADRIYNRISALNDIRKREEGPLSGDGKDGFVFIKADYHLHKIRFDEILYLEGMKDYIRVVTIHERIMTLMSFDKIMELLPSLQFIRVHKSYVVAIDKIERIERNHIRISDQTIPIGESYRKYFFKMLEGRKLI